MHVYKSEEGKELVQSACRKLYSRWPVPVRSIRLELPEFGRTHVLEMGPKDGPPLLLLHGSAGNSASWRGYAPGWAEHFHLFAVDIPGQPGLSSEVRPVLADGSARRCIEKAAGGPGPDLFKDTIRRWLEEVIRGLGLENPALCGMSLGGWIALDYAVAHPGESGALVLIASSGIAPVRAPFFIRILPLLFFGDWGSRRIIRMVHHPEPVHPEVEEFTILVNRHYRPLAGPIPLFSDAALASITVPVLYIGGEKDAMLRTRESAERLGRKVPGAQTVVLPNTGHVVLDQGGRIRDFLRSV